MKFISNSSSYFPFTTFCKSIVLLFLLFCFSKNINGQVEQKVELFKHPILKEAQTLHSQMKYKEAEALIDESLDIFFKENNKLNYTEALMLKAKVVIHQHRVKESLMWYDSCATYAKLNHLSFHEATALNAAGDIYNYKNQSDLAIKYSRAALKIPNQPYYIYSGGYENLSTAYLAQGLIDSADKYVVKAFTLDSLNNDKQRMSSDYNSLGAMYARKGNNQKAIICYLKAADHVPPNKQMRKYGIYLYLSEAFFQIKNLRKAKEYALKAKDIAAQFKLKTGVAKSKRKLGNIAEINGQYQAAINLYSESLEHFKKAKNQKHAVETYLGLAKSYLELNQIGNAKKAIEEVRNNVSESDNESLKLKYYVVESLYNLKVKNYKKTLAMLSKAEDEAKSQKNIFRQRDIFKIYADYYHEQGKMELAFGNLENYHLLNDSISQVQQAFIIHDLDARYQKAEQDLKIQKLDAATTLMNQKLSRRNWAIGIGGLILLLISSLSFVIFNLYKKNKEKTIQLSQKNNQLQKALNEKGFLLKEIHHRVKNNLQIVSSLLSLQARNVQDEVALDALKEGQSRVRSMALIHQNLYQDDDLIGVEAKAYIEKLSSGLFQSYNIDQGRIQLHTNIEDIKLDVDTIIPLGLIINELITNALKYAFEKDSKGNIHLELNKQNEGLVFSLKDDGIGLPSDFDMEKNQSLGYRLIKAFSQKLQAILEVEGTQGTKIVLKIPTS